MAMEGYLSIVYLSKPKEKEIRTCSPYNTQNTLFQIPKIFKINLLF